MNYGYPQQPYYPPMYSQQRQYMPQQQVQPQPMPQPQYETPIQDIRFVTSREAEAYIVMPNSKALLIDKQNGMAFLKSADQLGQSQTLFYKITPINSDGSPIGPRENIKPFNEEEFVKKADLESLGFVKSEDLNAQIQELKKLIDSLAKKNQSTKAAEK